MASKLDLFFPPMRDWFLPLVQEKPIQSEGTEMHPISLQHPISGSDYATPTGIKSLKHRGYVGQVGHAA
jgi:hypothetical protein